MRETDDIDSLVTDDNGQRAREGKERKKEMANDFLPTYLCYLHMSEAPRPRHFLPYLLPTLLSSRTVHLPDQDLNCCLAHHTLIQRVRYVFTAFPR